MKKIKISIKSVFEKVLFESEKESNTVKNTIEEAVLHSAYLRGANLFRASLSGASLSGASLSEVLTIKKAAFFTGIYYYDCAAIITQDIKYYIKLGCYTRQVADWDVDFWNNDSEFPDNKSIKSKLRVLAFETCKKWIEINK